MKALSLRSVASVQATPFEFSVDGELQSCHPTYDEARAAAEEVVKTGEYSRWDVAERIGNRRFNMAFGYRSGTTSTMDLAAMGVPISPLAIGDRVL